MLLPSDNINIIGLLTAVQCRKDGKTVGGDFKHLQATKRFFVGAVPRAADEFARNIHGVGRVVRICVGDRSADLHCEIGKETFR